MIDYNDPPHRTEIFMILREAVWNPILLDIPTRRVTPFEVKTYSYILILINRPAIDYL